MKHSTIALSVAGVLALSLGFTETAQAQSVAWDQQNESWHTQQTKHFRIHFRNGHERQAARALDLAEQSHSELTEFFGYQPSEKTDIVLVDEFDSSNGWATVTPYPQIRLFMSPPDEVNQLENNDEWMHLLIKHEYAHILHMEMGGGAANVLRKVFGRNPFLYPHALTPAFLIEGLAVYLETNKELGYGRLQGSGYAMQMRMELINKQVKEMNQVTVATREWPLGYYYLYGAYFIEYLADTYGEEKVQAFLTGYSRNLVPYFFLHKSARRAFGKDFDQLWSDFQIYLYDRFDGDLTQLVAKEVTGEELYQAPHNQVVAASPNGLLVNVDNGEDRPAITQLSSTDEQQLTHAKNIIAMDYHDQAGLVASRKIRYADGRVLADLFVYQNDSWKQLTERERFRHVKWMNDGRYLIAGRKVAGISELWKIDSQGEQAKVKLWSGSADTVLGRFDIAGDDLTLVASIKRPNQGWNLELFDLAESKWRAITDSKAVESSPSYLPNGKVLYSSDYDGVFNIYTIDLKTQQVDKLTQEVGGAFNPLWQKGMGLVYQSYQSEGYSLRHKAETDAVESFDIDSQQGRYDYPDPAPDVVEKSDIVEYSPWASLRPRAWLPVFDSGESQTRVGFSTNGADALSRHQYQLQLAYDTQNSLAQYNVSYLYDSRWMLQLFRTHDFKTFTQGAQESTRIEQSDSALLQRNHILNAFEDQLSLHAGVFWDKPREVKAAKFGPAVPYTAQQEALVGLAATFDNRESYLNVPGIGWGHYADVVAETNDWLSGGYKGEKYQAQWLGTLDLPGRTTLSLRLAGGYASDGAKAFKLGGSTLSDEKALFGRQTQGLRGYDESVQSGSRYFTQRLSATTWLTRVERNWNVYPIGLGDISATVFADSGSAWGSEQAQKQLTSLGASVTLETKLGYRFTLPVTLGYARGLDSELGKDQFYISIASSF